MEQLALFAVPAAARDGDENSDTGGQFAQIVTGQTDKGGLSSSSIEALSENETSSSEDDEVTNEEDSIIHEPGTTELDVKPRGTRKIPLPLNKSGQDSTPNDDGDATKFSGSDSDSHSDSGISSVFVSLNCEDQEEEAEMVRKRLERHLSRGVSARVFKRPTEQE